MRVLKLALISIVVLFGVITAIASLLPSHVRISRAIDVNAPASKVYAMVDSIRAWESWNEYIRFYHHKQWKANEMTSDETTIVIGQRSDTLVTAAWSRPSGNNFHSGYRIIAQDSLHSTLQWYFDFQLHWYPWEKFQSIVYDQQLGPDMEKSLQNLKRKAEQTL